jgi:hypothetical protein
MQVALLRLNFKLFVGQDRTVDEFKQIVRQFSAELKGADIALFFYAGHAIQVKGKNYLLPVDIELQSETDVAQKTILLDDIMGEMGRSARASVTFLDACRDSPELRGITRAAAGKGAKEKGSKWFWEYFPGLAPVEAGQNHFVGYSAAPGTQAMDGGPSDRNSPFTKALLKHIAAEVEISKMFKLVRRDVIRATGNRQQPEFVSRIDQDIYLNPRALEGHAAPGGPVAPQGPDDAAADLFADATFWTAIVDTNDAKAYEEYLRQFPRGRFVPLAKRKLEQAKFARADPRAPSPEQPPVSEGDMVEAAGFARVTRDHPPEEAQRGARAQARARAIALAARTGSPAQSGIPEVVASSRDAADLLGFMNRGITYDEEWTLREGTKKDKDLVRVELRTKVRLLRPDTDRRLTGQIEPVEIDPGKASGARPRGARRAAGPSAEIVSGQSFRLRIDAKKDAIIGIFGWQANGSMVRLYPESPSKPVRLRAGESVLFPRADDSYPGFATATLPDEQHNHEALIVVTGATNVPFDRLVPTLMVQAPQYAAADLVSGADFLSRLAALNDRELELLVLPYEVLAER